MQLDSKKFEYRSLRPVTHCVVLALVTCATVRKNGMYPTMVGQDSGMIIWTPASFIAIEKQITILFELIFIIALAKALDSLQSSCSGE
jgi:hypothetical protein